MTDSSSGLKLKAQLLVSGLERPIFANQAPGDSKHLFIAQQGGSIIRLNLKKGKIKKKIFATFENLSRNEEQGLLGFTFDPRFKKNRYVYAYLSNDNGVNSVQRYRVNSKGNKILAKTKTKIIDLEEPLTTHNAGWIGFGPDRNLYIATGDGAQGDPENVSQNTTSLLGKILRINPNKDSFKSDESKFYSIPSDNPFADSKSDSLSEIFAYGLRNPWRCSFDNITGEMYIADVGQDTYEEINVINSGSLAPYNFGWRVREGTRKNSAFNEKINGSHIKPIYQYEHGIDDYKGYSITGGYVYHDSLSDLNGHYFFADFLSRNIWSLKYSKIKESSHDGNNYTDLNNWSDQLSSSLDSGQSIDNVSSFAQDHHGDIYILDYDGDLFKILIN